MDMPFPAGPVQNTDRSLTGTNGKTTIRMLASIMKAGGFTTGMTSTDGVYIDGHLTVKGDMTGPTSAQIVLRDLCRLCYYETTGGIPSAVWLQLVRCWCMPHVAQALGQRGINTLDVGANQTRGGRSRQRLRILNADDPLVLQMADYCDAKRFCYVTQFRSALSRTRRSGGMAWCLSKVLW